MGSTKGLRAGPGCALVLVPALLAGALLLAAPASADIDVCTAGSAAGHCERPEGLALDPGKELLYVADRNNNRIDVFDAGTGAFLWAFGWGVADGTSAELQTCHATCFKGLSGGGAGEFGGKEDFPGVRRVAVDPSSHAVYTFGDLRVQRFTIDDNGTPVDPTDDFAVFDRAWGGGVITGGAKGTGELESGSTTISNVKTTAKAFQAGQTISGAGIPAGTKIVSLGFNDGTIALSKAAEATATGVALTVAEGAGNVPVNEVQEITSVSPEAAYQLEFTSPAPDRSTPTTGTLTKSASAASIQAALEGLANIGAGNVAVSGPTGGPYTIEFKGRYADTDVAQLTSFGLGTVTHTTIQNGAASPELCTAAHAADCAGGVAGKGEGQFGENGDQLAVGPGGTVYVGDNRELGSGLGFAHRVEKFEPSGAFAGQFALPQSDGFLEALAIDSSGNPYITFGEVGKYDPAGNLLATLPVEGAGLAVDGSDNLFASGAAGINTGDGALGQITKLNSAGATLSDSYTAAGGSLTAVAPDPSGTGAFASEGQRVIRVPAPPPGPVVHRSPLLNKATEVRSARATLNAAVDPEGKATTYRFEYITAADFAANGNSFSGAHPASLSAATSVGSDFSLHEVSFKVTGLAPETSYRFRATASNTDGNDTGPEGEPFTTLDPLQLGATWATEVGIETARLHAEVNPLGTPASGYFEYVTAATCQADEEAEGPEHCFDHAAQLPDVAGGAEPIDFGSGEEPLAVSRTLFPLTPDTAYRFRIVAHDHCKADPEVLCSFSGPKRSFTTFPAPSEGDTSCPNQAFRTGPSANLPDCRAYEMVSPVDKNNSDVAPLAEFAEFAIDQAAAGGDALTFTTNTSSFAESLGGPNIHPYMAQRDPEGWSTRSIASPRSSVPLRFLENLQSRYKLFTDDLCSGWELQDTDATLVEGAPQGYPGLYRRGGLHGGCGEEGGYELLSSVAPPGFDPAAEKESSYYPQIQGFSADGAISVFRADGALSADACHSPEEGRGIYQLYLARESAPGVQPKLLSVLPGGEAACTHSSLGTPHSLTQESLYHAVSADGSRVYWTASKDAPGTLYLRLNATQPQSALSHFAGSGKLSAGSREVGALVAAKGKGTLTAGSTEVTVTETSIGQFVVGQPIEGKGIPAATTILQATGPTLTLSAPVEAGKSATNVAISSAGPLPFAAGQTISGEGIPTGTTILAAEAGKLTLSAEATASKSKVPLSASACTEPQAACTLAVSAEAEALSGTEASQYLTAATDGSAAIFSSGEDLYEYDLAKALAGEGATHQIAGKVKGIMGASSDASRIYLVSEEVLDEGAGAGKPNLYLYEAGGAGSFTFVATLGSADASNGGSGLSSPVAFEPSSRISRVSPDGLHAAFMAADPALAESVAGYDNTDAASGKPDREVYLYDATANGGEGQLICASCNPSGARPVGRVKERTSDRRDDVWTVAQIPGWTTSVHPGNALSANGRRLFFESFEALVPRDTNGKQDVYEWERAASKDECLKELGGELFEPQSEGCLSLISSGQSAEDSEFVDASADGSDAFFLTTSSLLPQDTGFRDVYDARTGGGFPPPPPRRPECEGDACRNPAAVPNHPTPATSALAGEGNIDEGAKPRCAKGKAPRKGRCVAKNKHKRSHKRQHARAANRKRGARR
jgi:hypothetical protein